MRVLITGGAGFIGLHLAELLAQKGAKVTFLIDQLDELKLDSDLQNFLNNPDIEYKHMNLLDENALRTLDVNYSHVVHLAAILGVTTVLKNAYTVLRDNNQLNINALHIASMQTSLKQLIFASTSEVYAGTLEAGLLMIPSSETSPLVLPKLSAPRTSYMLSKIYGEALVQHLRLPYTIIRPHNVYGPRMGMRHVIPELMSKAYFTEDQSIEVFSMAHSRTFCFVTDAVQMIFKIMKSEDALGHVFNIGTQQPEVTIENLAKLIIKIVNKDLLVIDGGVTEGSPIRRAPDMTKFRTFWNWKICQFGRGC